MVGASRVYPGGIPAVDCVDLEVAAGELYVVLGPSGSGKTTMLRMIAGLEPIDAGELRFDGESMTRRAARDRDAALVFQQPVLFPHLSVRSNLTYPARARGVPRPERAARVLEAARAWNVEPLLDRAPRTLSGGQKQRVALARAMVRRPRVLLLDEPFSSLDAPLRAALRDELTDWQRRSGVTTILVTHDQAEALALADRVAVTDRGKILQVGPPHNVYDRPNCRFVAEFLGSPPMNVLPARLELDGDGRLILSLEGLEPALAFHVRDDLDAHFARFRTTSGRLDLGLRPEHSEVVDSRVPGPRGWVLSGTIIRVEPLGHETITSVAIGPHVVKVRRPARVSDRVGEVAQVSLNLSRATLFNRA